MNCTSLNTTHPQTTNKVDALSLANNTIGKHSDIMRYCLIAVTLLNPPPVDEGSKCTPINYTILDCNNLKVCIARPYMSDPVTKVKSRLTLCHRGEINLRNEIGSSNL